MRKDRLIAGLICIALAVWVFLTGKTGETVAPALAIAVLGIVMVAISRRR
ncbi:MAG: hypothetical protein ABIB93_07900 [Chloroflexota bacterium]